MEKERNVMLIKYAAPIELPITRRTQVRFRYPVVQYALAYFISVFLKGWKENERD